MAAVRTMTDWLYCCPSSVRPKGTYWESRSGSSSSSSYSCRRSGMRGRKGGEGGRRGRQEGGRRGRDENEGGKRGREEREGGEGGEGGASHPLSRHGPGPGGSRCRPGPGGQAGPAPPQAGAQVRLVPGDSWSHTTPHLSELLHHTFLPHHKLTAALHLKWLYIRTKQSCYLKTQQTLICLSTTYRLWQLVLVLQHHRRHRGEVHSPLQAARLGYYQQLTPVLQHLQ